MSTTQGVTSRGVGTAGAQTYEFWSTGSTWAPTSAVYLSGREARPVWWFGHRVYGDKEIRPLGGNCYEITAYYVAYYRDLKETTSSAATTKPLSANGTLSTDPESPATATTSAPVTTSTTSTSAITKTLPRQATVYSIPSFNEGIFTGTVYTDAFDNSTFAVICGKNQYQQYSSSSLSVYVYLGMAVAFVVVAALAWFAFRWQRKFWSTHSATITVGPGGSQQVLVGPQHIAMLQQQQPMYASTSPNQYSGYGKPDNFLSGSYPVYGQSQNNAGMSVPAPVYGQHSYGQQNYDQQNYGQQNSMSGNQHGNNVTVVYADPPPAGSTYRPDGVERK
ncbi:hypothetical protein BJ741DRAFT_700725 [Chytriomyces cf. hyalinus JEL632]|nr:hypothetical protein BJ741DRAFT_700725 [Chytriomyces cf. hyalinus JEL632]